jgi:hypothetical protein
MWLNKLLVFMLRAKNDQLGYRNIVGNMWTDFPEREVLPKI